MSLNVPNLTLLRQFVVVAEEKGISPAARRLRISQPALSKNIRKLEAMLDTRLVERTSGGTVLTEAGRVFYQRAQVIGLEYEHALQDIGNVVSRQNATVRMGAGPIWTSTVLPDAIERFHQLYPQLRVQIITAGPAEVGEELRVGRMDLYAGALLRDTVGPGFTARRLARADLAVLAGKTHPLHELPPGEALSRLSEYPFVSFSAARDAHSTLSAFLRDHGLPPPRIVCETSSLFGCLELVRKGDFLLYETRMITECPVGFDVTPLEIGQEIKGFDMGIVYREGLDSLPHVRRLMAIMAEVLHEKTGSAP